MQGGPVRLSESMQKGHAEQRGVRRLVRISTDKGCIGYACQFENYPCTQDLHK